MPGFPNCPVLADGEPCSCTMLGGNPASCIAAGGPVGPLPLLAALSGTGEDTMTAFFGQEPVR